MTSQMKIIENLMGQPHLPKVEIVESQSIQGHHTPKVNITKNQ